VGEPFLYYIWEKRKKEKGGGEGTELWFGQMGCRESTVNSTLINTSRGKREGKKGDREEHT